VAGKDTQIAALVEPSISALGFTLWGVEYSGSGRSTVLRVYIDSPAGITVDDCARVSRQLGSILDVEDPIGGEYTLEVSSPGLDRLLFTLQQTRDYVGERVDLRMRFPIEGRRRFRGVLKAVNEDALLVSVDGGEFSLPYDAVERARVEPGAL
jgi:ribosome maturation factor RimP